MVRIVCFLLGIGASVLVSAMPIETVVVDDREWIKPFEILDVSWNDTAQVCDLGAGACIGELGGVDVSGWIWADEESMEDLFYTDLGAGRGIGPADSEWAPRVVSLFCNDFCFPLSSTPKSVAGFIREIPFGDAPIAIVGNDINLPRGLGIRDIAFTSGLIALPLDEKGPGVWLYRAAAIPIPNTVWLFLAVLLTQWRFVMPIKTRE